MPEGAVVAIEVAIAGLGGAARSEADEDRATRGILYAGGVGDFDDEVGVGRRPCGTGAGEDEYDNEYESQFLFQLRRTG